MLLINDIEITLLYGAIATLIISFLLLFSHIYRKKISLIYNDNELFQIYERKIYTFNETFNKIFIMDGLQLTRQKR